MRLLPTRPIKMPRNVLASRIFFLWRWILLPCWEIFTCAHAALLTTRYQQSDWKSNHVRCQASNFWHDIATCKFEAKRTLSSCIPHVPKIGTTICFPYPAKKVLTSWHRQDGFFLHKWKCKVHKWKGKVNWCFHHCRKQCC